MNIMETDSCIVILVVYLLELVACNFGPYVKPTSGAVWPKPQEQKMLDGFFLFDNKNFVFQITNQSCSDLMESINRYKKIINETRLFQGPTNCDENYVKSNPNYLGYLDKVNITLNGPCSEKQYPVLNINEEYELAVTQVGVTLTSATIWGIYRGLETFSQLIHTQQDGLTLIVNATVIKDYPRFPYRGLLLDTSGHFLSVTDIKRTLDGMSYSKMNVFHWHITDDESFPYQSAKFPEMSKLGAYHGRLQYSTAEVRDIIEYARKRGIIVIPEFDTPGHTASWGIAKPELLTRCYKNGKPTDELGPLDPSKASTYKFMDEFLQEIMDVFATEYLHFGGDDVDYTCWKSNPEIVSFMKKLNVTGNFDKLLNMYMESLVKLVEQRKKIVIREELFATNATLPMSTIIHVWKSLTWPEMLENVTAAGRPAVLSSCWVTDEVLGAGDWVLSYMCDPVDSTLPERQRRLVLGGAVSTSTGTINTWNLDERLWPKAAATGERLWSQPLSVLDIRDIAMRLEEHTCRLNARGVHARPPNGASVCF